VCVFADIANESGFKYCSHGSKIKLRIPKYTDIRNSTKKSVKCCSLVLMTVWAMRMTMR
jgi:hypothetical protein